VAKMLPRSSSKKSPGLVLMGKQAIDNDMNADRPDAGGAAGLAAGDLRLEGRNRRRRHAKSPARSTAGLQTIKVKMPAIVTVDLRLNEPRYAAAEHHEGQEEAAG
jgi:electron transfer flavoprotein beta subunit